MPYVYIIFFFLQKTKLMDQVIKILKDVGDLVMILPELAGGYVMKIYNCLKKPTSEPHCSTSGSQYPSYEPIETHDKNSNDDTIPIMDEQLSTVADSFSNASITARAGLRRGLMGLQPQAHNQK